MINRGEIWEIVDRSAATRRRQREVPKEIDSWWKEITCESARTVAVSEVHRCESIVFALLQLCAVADEACEGIGLLSQDEDLFDLRWIPIFFGEGKSLCERIHPSRLVVLPKLHSPQSGLTLRSISHHLAFYFPGEVRARWRWYPNQRADPTRNWGLSLLMLPWPLEIKRNVFGPSAERLENMPDHFGFFDADFRRHDSFGVGEVQRAFQKAKDQVGPIDGIILPEASLGSKADAELIAAATGAFVVAGVSQPPIDASYGTNSLVMAVPYASESGWGVSWTQSKHHRWKLDKGQIRQYHIGEQLDPSAHWWEHIAISSRELLFVTFDDWLTMSFLICEDLARLDPVTELLRAVGPNLVIALLQDGPQLSSRWSSRYATVLADDPGSSVLTLTSLGMALASTPDGKVASRTVAMWKDARSGTAREISLSETATGVVLSLTREYVEEWTADGRTDRGTTAYLVFNEAHQII